MPEAYSLAVWKDCQECQGTGMWGFDPEMCPGRCPICNGHGKVPTFVPLKDVMLVIGRHKDFTTTTTPNTIVALQEWLERQES